MRILFLLFLIPSLCLAGFKKNKDNIKIPNPLPTNIVITDYGETISAGAFVLIEHTYVKICPSGIYRVVGVSDNIVLYTYCHDPMVWFWHFKNWSARNVKVLQTSPWGCFNPPDGWLREDPKEDSSGGIKDGRQTPHNRRYYF